MTVLSKLLTDKRKLFAISITGGLGALLWYYNQYRKNYKSSKTKIKWSDRDHTKAAVDMIFFQRICRILKILVPGACTPEAFYLIIIALALIARTYCDVWMIDNGTMIESAIISRDKNLFLHYLFRFIWAMPVISLTNNILKYGLSEIKLRFRTRLTRFLYDRYLNGFTFYKMSNLDNRIANADQLLTQDVEKFCDSVGDLYSNLSKPLLDIALYAIKLTSSIGAAGPLMMVLYLVISGICLNQLRRPVGRMTMVEQKLEGEYRFVNSRLITNSEEIAFYQGNNKEKKTINESFNKLVNHLRRFIHFRFLMGYLDNIIGKYIATVVGYLCVSRPFLDPTYAAFLSSSHHELLEDYYKSGRMLLRMAEALGRVALAGRDMARLSGFTGRVTRLMEVLEDLNSGHYERTMVNQNRQLDVTSSKGTANHSPDNHALADDTLQSISALSVPSELRPGSGKIITADNVIKFDNVPLVTPNGDILIESLTFQVKSGINVLVCGPNGCGKSSLFRVLGDLWPLFGGTLTKPAPGKLFYIPQRPYMTIGTLRDELIYPDTIAEQKIKGITDAQLADMLEKVQLAYILDREGGWEAVQDWMDVLSGGEKQRIAMARVFYHQPQFAILDECTSAVSVDVEGYMYDHCRKVGITLFTVSHRKSLWKHHEYYLHMDGRGNYSFKKITEDTQEFGS